MAPCRPHWTVALSAGCSEIELLGTPVHTVLELDIGARLLFSHRIAFLLSSGFGSSILMRSVNDLPGNCWPDHSLVSSLGFPKADPEANI